MAPLCWGLAGPPWLAGPSWDAARMLTRVRILDVQGVGFAPVASGRGCAGRTPPARSPRPAHLGSSPE